MRARKGSPGARRGRRQRRQLSEHVASQSSSEGRHKKQFTDWVGSAGGRKGVQKCDKWDRREVIIVIVTTDRLDIGWMDLQRWAWSEEFKIRCRAIPHGGVRPRSLCTYILRGGFFAASAPACLLACLPYGLGRGPFFARDVQKLCLF